MRLQVSKGRGVPSNRTLTPVARTAAKIVEIPPITLAVKPAMWPMGSIANAFKFPKVKPA